MAEVVGLVVGGISLAMLFDQCLSIIKLVDSGKHCSDEYKDAALMLTLIGGRLNRWGRTIRESPDLHATDEDGEQARLGLTHVRERLEQAEKLGRKYNAPAEQSRGTGDVSSMVEKLQSKLLLRRNGGGRLSLARRTRWALTDHDKMQALVENLDMLVGSLEALFTSLRDQRVEMLRNDVAGLLESADPNSEPMQAEAVEALNMAATRVDKDLEEIASSPSSHLYRNIETVDEAMVNIGDYISPDFANASGAALRVSGAGHRYDGIRSSGNAVVNIGNMYGKSIFEMPRK